MKTLILLATALTLSACVNGRPAPWLNVKACYTLPDGTQVCGGVEGGNVNLSAATGYAKKSEP